MKSVTCLLVAALISNTAFAKNENEVDQLFNDSQAQVKAEIKKDVRSLRTLIRDASELERQIGVVEGNVSSAKTVGTVTLVISAGLAAYTGYLIHKPIAARGDGTGLMLAIGRVVGTIVTGAGAAGAGVFSAGSWIKFSIEKSKLNDLKESLKQTKQALESKVVELEAQR
jgi:hypothetical protein